MSKARRSKPDARRQLLKSHPIKIRIRRVIHDRQRRLEAGKDDRIALEGDEYILLRVGSSAEGERAIKRVRERVRGAIVNVRRIRDRSQGAAAQRVALTIGDGDGTARGKGHGRLTFDGGAGLDV